MSNSAFEVKSGWLLGPSNLRNLRLPRNRKAPYLLVMACEPSLCSFDKPQPQPSVASQLRRSKKERVGGGIEGLPALKK